MRFFALAALAYVATAVQIEEAEPTQLAPAEEVEEIEMPEDMEPASDNEMAELEEVADDDENLELASADAKPTDEQDFVEEHVDEASGKKVYIHYKNVLKRRKVLGGYKMKPYKSSRNVVTRVTVIKHRKVPYYKW